MINGVILRKLEKLDETLHELESLGHVKVVTLKKDWIIRRAVERNLQVLSEIVLDICQRLISISGEAPATTGAGAVRRCVTLGIFSAPDPFQKMIQFRNFIVHRYEQIDVEILSSMCNKHLSDYKQFKTEVLEYVRQS